MTGHFTTQYSNERGKSAVGVQLTAHCIRRAVAMPAIFITYGYIWRGRRKAPTESSDPSRALTTLTSTNYNIQRESPQVH